MISFSLKYADIFKTFFSFSSKQFQLIDNDENYSPIFLIIFSQQNPQKE